MGCYNSNSTQKVGKKNAAKLPAMVPRLVLQAPEMEPSTSQKEMMHASEIMELLLDIPIRLQATEHYVQAKHNQDADADICHGEEELHMSPCQRSAPQVSQLASSPPHTCETAAAELSEDVWAKVTRRMSKAPVLTIST